MSAAKQMQMQMMYRLSAIVACIHNDPVAVIQLFFARDLCCRSHQMTHQHRIFSQRLRHRADVLFRNNQQMGRSLRIDVWEPDAKFIFIDTACRDSAVDDLAEQAVRVV